MKTISQKTPVNYDNLARGRVASARKYFREKKAEVVLERDEFFVQYHSGLRKVLASKGAKYVGSAIRLGDAKERHAMMITIVLEGSCLLTLTIVFNSNYLFNIIIALLETNLIISKSI